VKKYLKSVILVLLVFGLLTGVASAEEKLIKMSTTTSTQASGLLDVLLPELEKDTGIQIKVIAKGTGAAIRDGVDGNVDVIFVHAKGREEQFVAEGYGTKRYAVMHNDFIILGPKDDPAGIKVAIVGTYETYIEHGYYMDSVARVSRFSYKTFFDKNDALIWLNAPDQQYYN
jgi:ABC-type tungstate transport system permease subunit